MNVSVPCGYRANYPLEDLECEIGSGHRGLHRNGVYSWPDDRMGAPIYLDERLRGVTSKPLPYQPVLKAYAGAVSDADDMSVGEHVQGNRRVSAQMESDSFDFTGTMAGDSVTLHLADKKSGRTLLSITLTS